MAKIGFAALAGLGGILLTLGVTASASAQQAMGNQPWNFTAQNRAGIAALIQGGSGNGGTGGSAYACGGSSGAATATANYTCIILNNSTATIGTDQDSDGDQTATSDTETSVNGVPDDDLSEVLENLTN